jgi:glucose-1-phosphate thymidylyltransferase
MNNKPADATAAPLIGLIPAGGMGQRLAPLPCSKEIFPLGFYRRSEDGQQSPKVAGHYLIDGMRAAGVRQAFIILRPGKWDIPAYFGNGESFGIHLAYLIRNLPFGVPFTVDCAYPFVEKCRVAFGFPDILFRPDDALSQLAQKQEESGADLVLGLFPTDSLQKWDLVERDSQDRIVRIAPRPHQGTRGYTWCIAVWSPEFAGFIHRTVRQAAERLKDAEPFTTQKEIPMGEVFQAAIADGIPVEHIAFEEGFCLDIGTPDDLKRALRMQLDSNKRVY